VKDETMNGTQREESAPSLSRRSFLKRTGSVAVGAALNRAVSLTAAERARAVGANDRIRVAQIGCGTRGIRVHMGNMAKQKALNVEVVAVADPWRVAREKAVAKAKESFGTDAKAFVSYRDLLAMDGIDAVMIASCDHQHTTHLEAAARAGKHVYVEKPMATEFDRLVKAVDAVKKAGVVVQVGTQVRSLPTMVGCRELVQSGVLGQISRVEEVRNGARPYWYAYLKDVRREDVDWDEFLMDRPKRPFRADIYSGWYGYYDFSQGPVPGLGSHYIDLVHMMTGATCPDSCVCLGGTFYWKDEHEFTSPDQCQALWTYPEGFLASYVTNFANSNGSLKRLYGDKGTLKFDKWSAPVYTAEGGPKRDGSIRGENPVRPVDMPDHFVDWIQCMRSGKTPHASIDAGYQHSVAVLMAMKSYETGRKVLYDAGKREMKTV